MRGLSHENPPNHRARDLKVLGLSHENLQIRRTRDRKVLDASKATRGVTAKGFDGPMMDRRRPRAASGRRARPVGRTVGILEPTTAGGPGLIMGCILCVRMCVCVYVCVRCVRLGVCASVRICM